MKKGYLCVCFGVPLSPTNGGPYVFDSVLDSREAFHACYPDYSSDNWRAVEVEWIHDGKGRKKIVSRGDGSRR